MFVINTEHVGKAFAGQDESVNDQTKASAELSDREVEILRLIMDGKTSKEAADILCCSKRTVDSHLGRIYDKLDVSNRVQAIRRVSSLGLILSLIHI